MHFDQSSVEGKRVKKSGVRPEYLRVLLITVILGSILGVFLWQQNEVSNTRSQYGAQIQALESRISALQKELRTDTKTSEKTDKEAPVITEAMKENVSDAVSSENYAALESYMADSIEVILAASEGIGARTPAQAVADLRYISSATAPWDFDLADTVLTDWRSGDYARYLPADNILVGRSSDGYVVAFVFTDAGKISNIFMTNNDELL